MSIHADRLAIRQQRTCLLIAALLLAPLLALTLGLWRASILFIDYRMKDASSQSSRETINRLAGFIESRLIALRQVSHFYAYSDQIREEEFQGFCRAVMEDVPGILAILSTDRDGNPVWVAPKGALPMTSVYGVTGDPKLKQALERSLVNPQPTMTEPLDVPEVGAGFLAAAPIKLGGRHIGYIVGVFHYQGLLSNLLQPDLVTHYRLGITHAGWPVYPMLPMFHETYVSRSEEPGSYGVRENIMLGGQYWTIGLEPLQVHSASPANFVSLTILSLGLSLSLLLTYLTYRWRWQAVTFKSQARDSEQRLERTGLNLEEIKSELNLILNSVDEAIVIYNERFEPLQANAAFLMAFGIAEDGALMQSGHAHHEHLIQQVGSETKYWSLFNNLHKNPEQSYTDELDVQAKNARGPVRIFLRRAIATQGSDGTPRGVIVIYKDMTKIKAMDRVKDEFLSNITHELRSPLASIKGFAETIRRDAAMPAETRTEFVTIICEEAARLQDLIEELLDLRRLEAGGVPIKPAPYDLKQLVDEVVRGVRSVLLTKKLSIKVQWDGLYETRLQGDVIQISRALRNLLVNAVKYSPEGAEVTVRGHCGQQRLWVEVADQGAGIDERDLPHIFDKFYRGSRQGRQKGTGLGLSIVKNIVELHGGHLGVRSEVGHGTTFRIELPRTFQPAARGEERGGGAPEAAAALDEEEEARAGEPAAH